MSCLIKTPLFIPSFNRAPQLNLLLDSLEENANGLFQPYIYYKVNNELADETYERLIGLSTKYKVTPIFNRETKLRDDFINFLKQHENVNVGISTDDTVFFGKMEDKWNYALYNWQDNFCFSLRLGLNTTIQDYKTGRRQPPLKDYTEFNDIIMWNWKKKWHNLNYGYPIGMDGVVYRAKDLLSLTIPLKFESFRTWEGVLTGFHQRHQIPRPDMASFKHSVAVNIPANAVQWPPLYYSNKCFKSIQELNRNYMAGKGLSLKRMDFSKIVGAHQEITLR